MPSFKNTNYPRLSDPDEFENMVRDICAEIWQDPETQRHGRKGQKQFGVDVYGNSPDVPGNFLGAQAKLRTMDNQLSRGEIEHEINEAKSFPDRLQKVIIATDAPRDISTQQIIRDLNNQHVQSELFEISIWFWEDIVTRLSRFPRLLIRYFPQHFTALSNLPIQEEFFDSPIRIFASSTLPDGLEEGLTYRGIHVTSSNIELIDGAIFLLENEESLAQTIADVKPCTTNQPERFPIFLIANFTLLDAIEGKIRELNVNDKNLRMLDIASLEEGGADEIFNSVFQFGYRRRGMIPSINITARSTVTPSRSSLLDMDFSKNLSTSIFPSAEEWKKTFVPAIEAVKQAVASAGTHSQISFSTKLPVPAAIFLGHHFSIREFRTGVWARHFGTSNFQNLYWDNSSRNEEVRFSEEIVSGIDASVDSAIIELVAHYNVDSAIREFSREGQINVTNWIRLRLAIEERAPANITQTQAISYANKVGQLVRKLNSQGILHCHFFCRIPAALGFLIGQRLHASGVINLYWFDNPSYKYAFSIR